jgi:S-(hydroxymethyl)glutathione dehydrogenase/alcohol dehydrogenase
MKAAVLQSQNAPLIVKELIIPELSFGQVLVRVHASGICGAQMGEISGANGEDRYLPHLLGHEGGGIVVEVGPGVRTVKPKDHVVLHWRKGTGMESSPPVYTDMDGHSVGAGWVTTFNDYAIVSENRITKIDNDIPFEIAALMGCAVTTGLGLVNNEAQLKMGQSILVAGCGGVGLNVIQGAVLCGGNPIIAVDSVSSKLEMAKSFGATDVVLCSDGSDFVVLKPVDVFVDCTGNPDVIASGYALAKKTILVGQPRHDQSLIFPAMRRNYCGKILMDSQGGFTNPAQDIPNYLGLYKAGKLNLDGLITHRFGLDDVNEAMNVAYSGKAIRVILEMK